MTTTRTSEQFVDGLKFFLEAGGGIKPDTVGKLAKLAEAVENPTPQVSRIQGMLETARDTDIPSVSSRVESSLTKELEVVAEPSQGYNGPVALC